MTVDRVLFVTIESGEIMKQILRYSFITVLLALIVACATPTTVIPVSSQQEIQRERNQQIDMMKGSSKPSVPAKKISNETPDQRLARIAAPLGKAGMELCQRVFALQSRNCQYQFKVEKSKEINAYADGRNVTVTTGMMDFTTDDELAIVVGHELAHNIMEHVQKTQRNVVLGGVAGLLVDVVAASQGIDTGGNFSKTGAQMGVVRYSPAFEEEADYVGLYILAIAGYPIDNAPSFWRKMSAENPNAIDMRVTHPTNPERYLLLEKTVAEIKRKQSQGLVLQPEIQIKK